MLANHTNQCIKDAERNTRELDEFAIQTLEAYIDETEKVIGRGKSSLRVFARIDIGVFKGVDGLATFFVNEIEPFGATLFQSEAHCGPVMASVSRFLHASLSS